MLPSNDDVDDDITLSFMEIKGRGGKRRAIRFDGMIVGDPWRDAFG